MIKNMPESFPVPQEETIDGRAVFESIGLPDLAGQQVEAHGGTYTYAQAIEGCPPFAKMLTGMAASLEGVPNREEILRNTVQSMQAPKGESPAFLAQEL
jgi:hypothetical protein